MGRQERGQVPRDGGIGRVRQTEFAEARLHFARFVVQAGERKEAVQQHGRTSSRSTSTRTPPPISLAPVPGKLNVTCGGQPSVSTSSLTRRQMRTRTAHWCGCKLPPSSFFQVLGQRQVLVVSAQDQVIAHRHAMKLDLVPFAAADADQGKIRRPAADVADQDLLARLDAPLPVRVMRVDPGVKGRLRLFDQHHARQSGRGGRLHGQFAGHFVERSRQREHDVLILQRIVL